MLVDFTKTARQRLMDSIMAGTVGLELNPDSVKPLYFVTPPGHEPATIHLHYVNQVFRRRSIKLKDFDKLKNKLERIKIVRRDIATIPGVEAGTIFKLKTIPQPTYPQLITFVRNYLQIELDLSDVDVYRSVNQLGHAELIISNLSLRYIGKLTVIFV